VYRGGGGSPREGGNFTLAHFVGKEGEASMNDAALAPPFEEKVSCEVRAEALDVLQINIGYRCNLECRHCHVEAGPRRREAMPADVMEECVKVFTAHPIAALDITGGSPEMHPRLPWLLEQCAPLGRRIIIRTNGVILLEAGYETFIDLYERNGVEVTLSLPHTAPEAAERQRGPGVFVRLIEALRRLNDHGYGRPESGLVLNLVHNPGGAYLPASQAALEAEYRRVLQEKHGVCFDRLFCITNMPVGRYLEYLRRTDNYEDYMKALVRAFNPATLGGVMCKRMLSVGWDGRLYDCDFNQMLGLGTEIGAPGHVAEFDLKKLVVRRIVTGDHCYGCTAGAGSSCGGEVASA
jgi:radical SAM/Cys-rich protein